MGALSSGICLDFPEFVARYFVQLPFGSGIKFLCPTAECRAGVLQLEMEVSALFSGTVLVEGVGPGWEGKLYM